MLPNPLLLLNAATFWASWGIALSLAPQQKPMMIKNVVIANGQLLSVLDEDDGALDQHQPEQEGFPHPQSIVSHTQMLHLS